MNWQDIPKMTIANYQVDVSWKYLEEQLANYERDYGLELEPDFQRSHVWKPEQQTKYIEWIVRNGKTGKEIYFNCPNWRLNPQGPIVLVDGLQRMTAVREFLNNNIPIFDGYYINDIDGKFPWLDYGFRFYVNDLCNRKEVIQWYIDLNENNVAHTKTEINKAKRILEQEEDNAKNKKE